MSIPDETAYESWITRVFDHSVTDPAWHWDLDTDMAEPEPFECVLFLTQLFEKPEVLAVYSDAQVNQGFWYLVSNSCSNYMFCLIEPEVDWPLRQRGIRAIAELFRNLFNVRCTNHLSHIDGVGAGGLNSVCYMWWDIFPASGQPANPDRQPLDGEPLDVMKQTLMLDSMACQESALHGLGHWQMEYSRFVESTIDEFVARIGNARPELLEYARNARRGYMQ